MNKHINFIHLSETDGIKHYEDLKCIVIRRAARFVQYTNYGYKEIYPLKLSPLPQMQEYSHKPFMTVKSGCNFTELDAGKNITAKVKFTFFAEQKTTIKIYYSESYYQKGDNGAIFKEKRDDQCGEPTKSSLLYNFFN